MMRIALLGDLHYPDVGSNNEELSVAVDHFFGQYLREFFSVEADFHVSIGDLTHLGLESEFVNVYNYIKQYNINFRAVLGNHDVLSLPKEKISSLIQQSTYDLIETQGSLLLFLDTTKEFELHGWGLDQKQWQWLEKQIDRSKEKPLFICPSSCSRNNRFFYSWCRFSIVPRHSPIVEKKKWTSIIFQWTYPCAILHS
ncbi:metallophosphoesterase [Bacillus sp. FJAT-49732]|uniref:Metallophosphoesterase n=1 Tax=Lederbergia citrisecunda TaxID=2833583 RepID=A0A942TIA7_9BACI|nr:metallophosphoesterase [Lederbergia citrisecunda]MBS4198160.1 metallophosphoesterase [Lederbergia citrisecunda]